MLNFYKARVVRVFPNCRISFLVDLGFDTFRGVELPLTGIVDPGSSDHLFLDDWLLKYDEVFLRIDFTENGLMSATVFADLEQEICLNDDFIASSD